MNPLLIIAICIDILLIMILGVDFICETDKYICRHNYEIIDKIKSSEGKILYILQCKKCGKLKTKKIN